MIRRLKYNEIDFEKYTRCLENSEQRKYSATKDFLDITSSKQWDLLIFNDYEAVMPVPFITKFGVKLVVNPRLCQQLGIFSERDDIEINNMFLDFFEKKYLVWHYAFNDINHFTRSLKQRKNFLIYPENYELIRQRYSPKRKRKLRLDSEVAANSEIKFISFKEAKEFIVKHSIGARDTNDMTKFLKIFNALDEAALLQIVAFIYNKEIINVLALYTDHHTIALLGTFNDKKYIKFSGSSVLIDHVISENIDSKIFDFEGSEVPSIEEFFSGFRPILKKYPILSKSKKELIKKFFRMK
ncbi:hypothetical protein [Chryseobacterium chendengshani]|uniref:hypothetical protein n=1 Tax=Chryseobacterium sp. LJ756 TaxID=2864113 RepID=UPI001C63D15A|nr:hypothetical protein [Chryseobacterium sp. LJ756]MBW7674442.1 hypothetical protein [Chryseobacterium sp. LJ756]